MLMWVLWTLGIGYFGQPWSYIPYLTEKLSGAQQDPFPYSLPWYVLQDPVRKLYKFSSRLSLLLYLFFFTELTSRQSLPRALLKRH